MFYRIKKLCKDNNISITKLCILVTGSSGNLNTWKKGYMRTDYLQKISEYFNVSTDYLITGQKKSSPSELTENEQKIISLFKLLSESQQGQLIGRAEMMAEYGVNQNNNYTSQIAAFGGNNAESEISEENLKKALKALNKSDKKKTENK